MIVKDYQPLQIVENEGFCKCTTVLNANYKLSSRKNWHNMYNVDSKAYKNKLQEVDHLGSECNSVGKNLL